MNGLEFKQALAVALLSNPGFDPSPSDQHKLQVAITNGIDRSTIDGQIKAESIAVSEIVESIVSAIEQKLR